MKHYKIYNESNTIWKQWEQHRQIDTYIEQVLFNTDDLYIEEGVLDSMSNMLKNAGAKVKDAFQKYNPQELYNRAFINISNKKAELTQMHPNASKLFKIAANPRNIKLAMMAIALLGAIGGIETGAATDVLNDLPDDDQNLASELLKNHDIAQNVRDGDEALDGTLYDTDRLADGGVEVNYQGIDDHLDQLVQSGALDQQAADTILQCIDMKSGLEMGEFLEGVTMDSYDKIFTEVNTIDDSSGCTVTGEETFESYIKTTITDKNGNDIVLGEMKNGYTRDLETGEMEMINQTGGLQFDIITVMDANIQKLPVDQQDQLWSMINDRESTGLGIPQSTDLGIPQSSGSEEGQFNIQQQLQENNNIWNSYITEAGEGQKAQIQQLQQQYINGLNNVAMVMAQRAAQKNIPPGTMTPAKQL
jgi:hypothetical protein